jgi:methyl-accepting chemotaxis protein
MGLKKADTSSPRAASVSAAQNNRSADEQRRRARTLAKQQQASERIAGATITLTQGLGNAVTSRDQLESAVKEIASGAEVASTAANEIIATVLSMQEQISIQLESANISTTKTSALQDLLDVVNNDVNNLIANVSSASARQTASALMMDDLQQQAANINNAVKQVMRIADQTNLLALNAAIEAGRAGKHGKGFAVVADTVRTLAETSESNAGDIAELVEDIQNKARSVGESVKAAAETALNEVAKGTEIVTRLAVIKEDMIQIFAGGEQISSGANLMNTAINEARQGGQSIATSAEEQSAAAEQVLKTIDEQGAALNVAETASQNLEVQAEELKNSTDIGKSSEEVAAAAEELSTSIEEISRASTEIMTAISSISSGAEEAASAAEQASSGMAQIESGVELAERRAKESLEKGDSVTAVIATNKVGANEMITGLSAAAEQGKDVLADIQEIEQISRRIDKITDAIATVSIKTGMLAVNGAIEAARAGEFGKGFAVVSNDIQSLADDAADNIDQIKELVKGIQDQSVSVMNDLSSVSDESIAEVQKTKKTTDNLVTIETDMAEVLSGNQAILKASQEIAVAVTQSKKSLEQISSAAEEASSNAGEASAAAESQSKGGDDLAVAIEEIAAIADELQNI